jgi:hypothetical protein
LGGTSYSVGQRLGALFPQLALKHIERVSIYASTRAYPRGATIFGKGDPGTSPFAVCTGTVRIGVPSHDGRDAVRPRHSVLSKHLQSNAGPLPVEVCSWHDLLIPSGAALEDKFLTQCMEAASFDHLVGTGEQRGWHGKAERLRGFEVDHQFKIRRLLDR